MQKLFIFIFFLSAMVIACAQGQGITTGSNPQSIDSSESDQKYMLVWSDEFNDAGLPDSSKWMYDVGDGCPDVCGWGNNELEYYTDMRLKNARVEEGNLIIEARKESFGGKNYTSARLLTRGSMSWKYGRFEIRAKLPSGKGTWPAIWMLSEDRAYGGWPASGEIDIMEHVGFEPVMIYGSAHTDAYNHVDKTQKTKGYQVADAEQAFHTYIIEWTPAQITWWVDNTLYYHFSNEHKTYKEWPFDRPFYLILNIAVGGDWGGSEGVDEKIWPQKMLVDYVRIYQKK